MCKIIKRIISEKKITLPSLRNLAWKSVQTEMEKKQQIIVAYLNFMELNELIYRGEKLVCDKIVVLINNINGKSKLTWEIRLETQIRNLQQ